MADTDAQRRIGLLGATGIGVGAIVGGGILALAGVAYAATGPGAIVAFALNGVIAVLTALSFAEMSAAFPESGGSYTFAKKVLSIHSAFAVGWIVWFASIVAGVLYALGFAAYAVIALEQMWSALVGPAPPWLVGRAMVVALAVGATALYALSLVRSSGGGGQWVTVGKVLVFGVLIAGGLYALGGRAPSAVRASLTPFFPGGAAGLLQAMGYTFIALQGFDLIAAVAGEVREPARTVPRAMLWSLAAALAIYLPLLFVIATVGVAPGQSITTASAAAPETVMAEAARHFLGPLGFWLVIVAAVFSMLSALHANLLAASRFALTMAKDRTLPPLLGRMHVRRATPFAAVVASALTVAAAVSRPQPARPGSHCQSGERRGHGGGGDRSRPAGRWPRAAPLGRSCAGVMEPERASGAAAGGTRGPGESSDRVVRGRLTPEALTTVAPRPWAEIRRVARIHRCESLLLGLSQPSAAPLDRHVERLVSGIDCNVVVLRAPPGWQLGAAQRVLVPIGGRGDHDVFRARLLGSLCRMASREVTYLRILPAGVSRVAVENARRMLARIAEDEVPVRARVEVVCSDAVAAEVIGRAAESDLVILGLQRFGRRRKMFGDFALRIARDTACALVMISRRG